MLTEGGYRQAVEISQAAQRIAPKSCSAFILATAQEGRAWSCGDAGHRGRGFYQPEHHYRYDPAKSEAYTATTLAWLGDPTAEKHAWHILARLESATDGHRGHAAPPRPAAPHC